MKSEMKFGLLVSAFAATTTMMSCNSEKKDTNPQHAKEPITRVTGMRDKLKEFAKQDSITLSHIRAADTVVLDTLKNQ